MFIDSWILFTNILHTCLIGTRAEVWLSKIAWYQPISIHGISRIKIFGCAVFDFICKTKWHFSSTMQSFISGRGQCQNTYAMAYENSASWRFRGMETLSGVPPLCGEPVRYPLVAHLMPSLYLIRKHTDHVYEECKNKVPTPTLKLIEKNS